ncbi:MAG: hypothetical protein ABSE36_11765 [Terracidiphilus sp.]|jgi:hypothetical protein
MSASSRITDIGITLLEVLLFAFAALWLFRQLFPGLKNAQNEAIKAAASDATNAAVDTTKAGYIGASQGLGEELGIPDDLTKYGWGSIGMFLAGFQKFFGITPGVTGQGGDLGGDAGQLIDSYNLSANIPSEGSVNAIS